MNKYPTVRMRCRVCGAVYPLVVGVKATAPHGPSASCTANNWERVDD
jgi:rubredoxin